jgi:hypothetical protein
MYSSVFDPTDYFGHANLTAEQLIAMGYNVWTAPNEQGTFLGEGDTPTFLNLVDNGLQAYLDPTWGGWGGRSPINPVPQGGGAPGAGAGGQGAGPQTPGATRPRPASPNPNFTPPAQNGFAARMQWSVSPRYRDANHEPRVTVQGPQRISARPGETVRLRGEVSDPDGNRVTLKWWQFADADTYPGQVTLANPTAVTTSFQMPADATPGQTIHVILEGTDNGSPALTRYQRVIVTAF